MSLLSLGLFPVLIPLAVASIIFAVAMFGHLHFKHIKMNKVCVATSIVSIPFTLFFYELIQRLVVFNNVAKLEMHIGFMIVFFAVVTCFCALSARRIPSLLQIIGTALFCTSCFLILA